MFANPRHWCLCRPRECSPHFHVKKMAALWDITSYRLVQLYLTFMRYSCSDRQCRSTFQTSALVYQSILPHAPRHTSFHNHCFASRISTSYSISLTPIRTLSVSLLLCSRALFAWWPERLTASNELQTTQLVLLQWLIKAIILNLQVVKTHRRTKHIWVNTVVRTHRSTKHSST